MAPYHWCNLRNKIIDLIVICDVTISQAVESFLSSCRLRLAMGCTTVFLFVSLLQLTAVFSAAKESPTFSLSSTIRILENKQLIGYVVKRFDSPSLLSCGQQCRRNEWCTSTNYKMPSKMGGKGICELNKHDISLINENTNFHDEEGVSFLMLLKVISELIGHVYVVDNTLPLNSLR